MPRVAQLVKLVLADVSGQHRFYAERDPLSSIPSDFVREVVYSLLDRGLPPAGPCLHRCPMLLLAGFEDPLIQADAGEDFTLLLHALSGFGRLGLPQALTWRQVRFTFGDVLMRIEGYFEARPEARTRRHDAMVDVGALRWAFEQIGGNRA
ncbi:hypothetical protein [Pseudoxanthomonas putridarboris]|uniref:Uncharacterized protein n=1 Tax=Pseudoxanthomonas putridarboris TaxID=752605 RepID=A0ABU9J256_9GAMM